MNVSKTRFLPPATKPNHGRGVRGLEGQAVDVHAVLRLVIDFRPVRDLGRVRREGERVDGDLRGARVELQGGGHEPRKVRRACESNV